MLGKKENYKYLVMLEVDYIKQIERKDENKKRVPQKNENISKNQAL